MRVTSWSLACVLCLVSACAARTDYRPDRAYFDRSRPGPDVSALRAEVWQRIAHLSFRLEDDEAALHAFSTAQSLGWQHDSRTYYFEAWAHLRRGRLDEARAALGAMVRLHEERRGPQRPRLEVQLIPKLTDAIRAAEDGRSPGEPEVDALLLASEWPLPPVAELRLSPGNRARAAHYYALRQRCDGTCRGDLQKPYEQSLHDLIDTLPELAETPAEAELHFNLHRALWISGLGDDRSRLSEQLAAVRAAERGLALAPDAEGRARFLYESGVLQESRWPRRALSAYQRFIEELETRGQVRDWRAPTKALLPATSLDVASAPREEISLLPFDFDADPVEAWRYDRCVASGPCRWRELAQPAGDGPDAPAVGMRWEDANHFCVARGMRAQSPQQASAIRQSGGAPGPPRVDASYAGVLVVAGFRCVHVTR